ncbi:hypothetical protein PPERSA_05943 [Pseudocohnilembus persalinus]|uniref:Uncharacterized protein n=1 Tax=Pseudocohnilembus persalinus TaxID=266149 RepID=A0A0V0R4F5_PSEPJ|nr:hypothetical protein PPERSA_05943 [Pseudocohnilembus persalinus]|eukprot:KRX09274.1 hypothetical protein PPERSA_05943 [Pseudocohnilembus persalinus]
MSQKAHITRHNGGFCYAACQDSFAWWNASIAQCWRGCDFAEGRVNDPQGREEAQEMCKRYTSETMWTYRGELDNIQDLRVHAEMYPTNPQNIYRACLAGIRRQKF